MLSTTIEIPPICRKKNSVKQTRLLPPAYLFLFIVATGILNFLMPGLRVFYAPWNFLGFILIIIGSLINIVADNAFRKAATTVKPFNESTILVTGGVFRFTRNPMYLGFVLILSGFVLFLGSFIPFIVLPLFILLLEKKLITVEEVMLATKFGLQWLESKGKVNDGYRAVVIVV
jgi:protein-S-isoprenylcysteine O-methyltransferase Ste14